MADRGPAGRPGRGAALASKSPAAGRLERSRADVQTQSASVAALQGQLDAVNVSLADATRRLHSRTTSNDGSKEGIEHEVARIRKLKRQLHGL